ncbi:MAG: FHA domain-containing protein [Gemmatimonadota bacterium]
MATTPPPDASGSPLAILTPQAEESGEAIEVRSPVVHIGQGPQNEVRLDDDTVSTRHCRLEYDAGGWRVTDLESRNGTFVEGVKLAPGVSTPLQQGAMLAAGAIKFQFTIGEGADAERAKAEYVPPTGEQPLAERSVFRLPLWLLIAVVLLIVALIALVIVFGGGSPATETEVQALLAAPSAELNRIAA